MLGEVYITNIIFLLVSFLASTIGSICGVGGGIIIKPVLDAVGIMSVSSISFLSGCTVLSMSIISVYKNIKSNISKCMNIKISTLLGIGAAIGGILGNKAFQLLKLVFKNENRVGSIQSFFLILITIATLIYVKEKNKINTLSIENSNLCVLIGVLLGLTSAFLGIGGGPINLVVLSYFFSMKTKIAAANSIYIIMFSQITSFFSTIIGGNIPAFSRGTLIVMILGGSIGGLVGSKINKSISTKKVDKLFIYLILIIIAINIYNFFKLAV